MHCMNVQELHVDRENLFDSDGHGRKGSLLPRNTNILVGKVSPTYYVHVVPTTH